MLFIHALILTLYVSLLGKLFRIHRFASEEPLSAQILPIFRGLARLFQILKLICRHMFSKHLHKQ